jgi:hypothetical protein
MLHSNFLSDVLDVSSVFYHRVRASLRAKISEGIEEKIFFLFEIE